MNKPIFEPKAIIWGILIVVLCLGTNFLTGCLGKSGGGGGLPQVSPENSARMQSTLNGFMSAVGRKDMAAAYQFMSKRMQLVASDTPSHSLITVWDFGANLQDTSDDAPWTFLVPEGGIIMTSESAAQVNGSCQVSEQLTLKLLFTLIKEEGQWYIEEIVLSDDFKSIINLAGRFPLALDNQWKFQVTETSGRQSGILKTVIAGPEMIDGRRVYTIRTTRFEDAKAMVRMGGEVKQPIRPALRALFNPDETIERMSSDGGLFFYGPDKTFNNGVPLKLLAEEGKPGDISTSTFTFPYLDKTASGEVSIEVKPFENLTTPAQTFSVLPVDMITRYHSRAPWGVTVERETWLVARDVGVVGIINYEPDNIEKVISRSYVISAVVGGKPLTSPVSDLATPTLVALFPASGSRNIGAFSPISFRFNKRLNPVTVLPTTFLVKGNGLPVSGNIVASGAVATFTPAGILPYGATITVTIDTGVRDQDNQSLGKPLQWEFSTVSHPGNEIVVLEDSGRKVMAQWLGSDLGTLTSRTDVAFQVSNDNPALFSEQPAVSPDGTLNFTPATDANGLATVTVVVQNGVASTATGSGILNQIVFVIRVKPVNDAPAFAKGADQQVREDAGAQKIAGWATGINAGPTNEAAQTLVFHFQNDNASLFDDPPKVATDGALTFSAAPNAFGTASLNVSVWDDGDTLDGGTTFSATQTFTISVVPVNDPPTVVRAPDPVVSANAMRRTLPNWASGITPGPLNEAGQTVQFLVSNDQPQLFIDQPSIDATGTLTFTPKSVGEALLTFRVKDDGGTADGGADTTASLPFKITINQPSITWDFGPPISSETWGMNLKEVNGKIYAMGGGQGPTGTNAVSMYDPSTNTWQAKAPMLFNRACFGAGVIGNKIYVFGGNGTNAEVYDTDTNTWTAIANCPGRWFNGGAAVDGKLYMIGGSAGQQALVDRYDPGTNTWASVAPMPAARNTVGVAVINGKIYVAGGGSDATPPSTLFVYDPGSNTWVTKANMPTGRNRLDATAWNGKMYVIGGWSNANGSFNVVEEYNPETDTWRTVNPLLTPRTHPGMAAFNGKIFVVGGGNKSPAGSFPEVTLPFLTSMEIGQIK
jgi:N-acetylneuraminic acid mutarotase